jgi:OOP family OmpA-OmpF porin
LLLLLLSATQVFAENRPGSYTLYPFAGNIFFRQDFNYDDSALSGVGLGYNFDQKVSAELCMSYSDSKVHPAPFVDKDTSINIFRLEGLYHFPEILPDRRFIPFLAAGLGGMRFSYDEDGRGKDADLIADWGAGLKFFLARGIALRVDARHLLNLKKANDVDSSFFYTAGLVLVFGGKELKAPAPVIETPAVVEPEPLPAFESPFFDSDGDGVPDNLDKCPDTPAGVKVDASGCPIPEKAVVTERGTFDFGMIHFDFDKAAIRPASYGIIDAVVDYMKKYPDVKLEVQGHTDSVGSRAYNLKLSDRRSASVMKYIAGKGIAPERLKSKGFGMSKPVATNMTSEGRAKNRRTEFMPIW